jgi:glycerophosphoryl diester phosphodiesterase
METLRRKRELATTTGGEPVYDDACLVGRVHAMDSSIARKREQGRVRSEKNVAAANAAGLQVMLFTVDKPEDWQKMADAKVDAIITDDAEALVLWLRSRGLHLQIHDMKTGLKR